MKKQLLTICAMGAAFLCATSAYAQGLVTLSTVFQANTSKGRVFDIDGTTLINGANYVAQLFGGASNDPNTWSLIRSVTGTVSPGQFFDSGSSAVSGVAGGATFFYDVRVVNTTTGDSGSSRLNPVGGNFTPPQIAQVAAGAPPSTAANTDTFLNFQLAVVPEPSTVILGVMGGLAMLMRRRK